MDESVFDSTSGTTSRLYLNFLFTGNPMILNYEISDPQDVGLTLNKTTVYVEDLVNLNRNIVCHKSFILYVDFLTISCLDHCSVGYYGYNGRCLLCESGVSGCNMCFPGEVNISGVCEACIPIAKNAQLVLTAALFVIQTLF